MATLNALGLKKKIGRTVERESEPPLPACIFATASDVGGVGERLQTPGIHEGWC